MSMAGLPSLPAEYFAEQARVAFGRDQFAAAVKAATMGIPYDRRNPFLYWYLGQGYFAQAAVLVLPEGDGDSFDGNVHDLSLVNGSLR